MAVISRLPIRTIIPLPIGTGIVVLPYCVAVWPPLNSGVVVIRLKAVLRCQLGDSEAIVNEDRCRSWIIESVNGEVRSVGGTLWVKKFTHKYTHTMCDVYSLQSQIPSLISW